MAARAGKTLAERPVADEQTQAPFERYRTSPVKRRGWLVRRMLLLADVVGLLAAYAIARFTLPIPGASDTTELWKAAAFVATLPAWIVIAKLLGLYDHDEERTDHSTADDLSGVFQLLTTGAWVVVLVRWATPLDGLQLGRILVFWAAGLVLVMLGRAAARVYCRRHPSYVQNTVILGAGAVGQLVARKFLSHPEYGINVVGFVDDEPTERRPDLEGLALLGSPDELPEIVRELDIERIVVAFSNQPASETVDLLRSLNDFEVQIDVIPRFFDLVGPGVDVYTVEGLPLVGLRPHGLSRSSQLLKRALDLAIALPLAVGLLPVALASAVAIRLDSPGPILFRQRRMGVGGEEFVIWKFRTMVADAEEQRLGLAHLNLHAERGVDDRMFKAVDDPRVTRVGRVLRRWSLDELPQLLNVLWGEMSLVGPRPLVLAEDEHVAEWARKRLNLKPGMTGLWQVLGRNRIPFDEMVKLDYLYVTTWSLWKDVRLMLRTIPIVFARDGF